MTPEELSSKNAEAQRVWLEYEQKRQRKGSWLWGIVILGGVSILFDATRKKSWLGSLFR